MLLPQTSSLDLCAFWMFGFGFCTTDVPIYFSVLPPVSDMENSFGSGETTFDFVVRMFADDKSCDALILFVSLNDIIISNHYITHSFTE